MTVTSNIQQSIERNLSRLSRHLQPRYLIHVLALAGAASIAVEAGGSSLGGLIKAIGGSIGIEMLGHLLSKLDKDEPIDAEFITKFCTALDASGIEAWLSRSDLRNELGITARVIGTALQYHENEVVNKVLSGISHFERLRSEAIRQLQEEIVTRFDPEKRYLARLIHTCESRDGVSKYIDLNGDIRVTVTTPDNHQHEQRYVVDSSFEHRPKRASHKPATQVNSEKVEHLRSVIEKHKRFALLGDPGSGKTTTLRRMVVDLAWKRLQDPSAPIPLYLELPQWKHGGLYDFLGTGWELDADLLAAIVEGRVWIFLDGLNEMGSTGYNRAAELRSWVHGRNHPEFFVVTCRSSDYRDLFVKDEEETLSLGITTVQISPLDDVRIQNFAKQYLSSRELIGFLSYLASFDRRDQEEDDFDDEDVDETESLESTGLSKFTQNPFMLRALLFLYQDISEGELPKNIGALFEALVAQVWSREQNRQTLGWIDYSLMLRQLSHLAYHMIEAETGTSIALSVAQALVDPQAFPAMESANLIEISNGELRFSHQLIQEYFAAVAVKEMCIAKGRIPEQIIEPPYEWHFDLRQFDTAYEMGMETFKSMFPYRSRWKQVVIALCGLIADVDTIIQQIAEANPFLVVDCALSGVQISSHTDSKVVSSLKNQISNVTYWGERLWFADELSRYGYEPISVEDKVEYYTGLMDWDNVQAIGDSAVPTLLRLAKQWIWGYDDYYSEGIHSCLEQLGAIKASLQFALETDLSSGFDLVDQYGDQVFEELCFGLEHWNYTIRESSAELLAYYFLRYGHLGYIGIDIEAVLIKALNDTNWFVAKAAAYALWSLGTDRALRAYDAFWGRT